GWEEVAENMEGHESHQQKRKRVVHGPHREDPEVGWQRAVATEDDAEESGLRGHEKPAAGHPQYGDVEHPMRGPGHAIEERITGRGGSGMSGPRPHEQANEHEDQDENTAAHVTAERVELQRVGVRDLGDRKSGV